MEKQLKPCPFCGSKTAPKAMTVAEAECMDDSSPLSFEWASTHYTAVCDYHNGGCGASTGGGCETEEEAAEAWNRRAEI